MQHRNCAPERARDARLRRLARALRLARQPLTQVQLAELSGFPQSSLSMWENGRAVPSTEQVRHLEDALGLPNGKLLVAAGYVDLKAQVAPAVAERPCVVWRPSGSCSGGFPERAFAWLDEFRPLIESICLLRDSAYDDAALDTLLTSRPVLQLRLGWEFWQALADTPGDGTSDALIAVIGRTAFNKCRYALWGADSIRPIPAGAGVRAIPPRIPGQAPFRASER